MAIKKYVRCPVCGSTKSIKAFSRNYVLEILYNNFGGRGKSSWYPCPDGGVKALKTLFIRLLEDIVAKLKELDGCDFYSECLWCNRDQNHCPDKNKWKEKTYRLEQRNTEIRAKHEAGASTSKLAEIYNVDIRTIQRTLEDKSK